MLLVQVKSGTLVLPGVPKVAEQAVLRKLAKTYGKTWHFWQFDRGDKLPLGKPTLRCRQSPGDAMPSPGGSSRSIQVRIYRHCMHVSV